MEWIAARLNQTSNSRQEESVRLADIKHQKSTWRVLPAENYEPQDGRTVYRFFELFDLPNIPAIENFLRAKGEGHIKITQPITQSLEMKIWFALFFMPPLRKFW